MSGSEEDISYRKTPAVDKGRNKRSPAGIVEDSGEEVQNRQEKFEVDFNKILFCREKKNRNVYQASFKTNNQKIEYVWKTPQKQKQKLNQEYSQQFMTLFQQWCADLWEAEQQEEKLASMFRQQQKLFQQTRIAQTQRLKTFEQLYEHFIKSLNDLEKNHDNLLGATQSELKKEMTILQKIFMMETQQQEMASIPKPLQSMLV